jgi:hypothetical protein
LKGGQFKLIGLDIEGHWNKPLLVNAAAMSGCQCDLAHSEPPLNAGSGESAGRLSLEAALDGCRHIVACETTRSSVSIYDFPAPRDRTAVIVGNEENGIPRRVLKQADTVVSIPMAQSGLSSINVAAAAAITLYAFTGDLGRKRWLRRGLRQQDVDVLIAAPADPHELGSLLRSVYAFGWRRVFLSDPHKVWFTEDPRVILESRAAARRARNPLAVLPVAKLDPSRYDALLMCDGGRPGSPLSRLRLPECQRLLVVFGTSDGAIHGGLPASDVTVDYADRAVPARFRHIGSILLSVISQMLGA